MEGINRTDLIAYEWLPYAKAATTWSYNNVGNPNAEAQNIMELNQERAILLLNEALDGMARELKFDIDYYECSLDFWSSKISMIFVYNIANNSTWEMDRMPYGSIKRLSEDKRLAKGYVSNGFYTSNTY